VKIRHSPATVRVTKRSISHWEDPGKASAENDPKSGYLSVAIETILFTRAGKCFFCYPEQAFMACSFALQEKYF